MKRILVFVFILLASLSSLSAMSYPSDPHGFNGEIIVNDGLNPNGLTLIGKINGTATGSCIISDGKYDLVIVDNSGGGGTIEFYIGDEKAKETSEFIAFEVTELDLHFDTVPLDLSSCGNGVCDDGECSSCPIDCRIFECLGNGICDLEMRENCNTAPEDCGECSSNDDDSSNADDGSLSRDSSRMILIKEPTQTTNEKNIISLNSENQEQTSPGITGAVIGFVKSKVGAGLIFAVLIVILGILIVFNKRK